jgi:ATP-dependent helicase HrpB
MPPKLSPLPIDGFLPQIAAQLKAHRSVVLVAEPGAGKTTRVAPALLKADALSAENPNLVMLQPRRIAARAAAQRIADENAWEIGGEVGYHIRFEKKISPRTRLRILTEGILTRQLLNDPYLDGVGCVILDEFHERSLNIDLAIAMLRELQQSVRPDLMLLVMSATLEAGPAAAFLGGCPIINVPGRTFPVEIEYHPHAAAPVVSRVAAAVEDILARAQSEGDILAFLPGAEEIRRTIGHLESAAQRFDVALYPLHGSLPPDQQTLALAPSKRRKVILATNIAETSLTIDSVRWVVDSGLARLPVFDPQRGLDRLELRRISKASATQRAGRAGRTAAGHCVRLWSAKEHAALKDFELPEVRRVDLCSAVLDLCAWGKPKAEEFGWFEAPAPRALTSAQQLLELLGAIAGGQITPLGRKLTMLPLHPRIARLLLAAAEAGWGEQGAAIAALLSEKDIRRADFSQPRHARGPTSQADSDVLLRLDDLTECERQHFSFHLRDRGLDPVAARQVAQTRGELRRIARRWEKTAKHPPAQEDMLKAMLLAYPDRVCRRRKSDPSAALMTGGTGVRLAPESAVTQSEFFLALDARDDERAQSREALVRLASAIEVAWLEELYPQFISRAVEAVYDQTRQRVVGRVTVKFRNLVLSEESDAAVKPAEAGAVLGSALRAHAREIFLADEKSAQPLSRLAFLRHHMPEQPWPEFDDNTLGDILEELAEGKITRAEVLRQGLAEALLSRLPYPLPKLLREHAPESLEVPSGSHIPLQYRSEQAPILAVRLQEIFGWQDTPRVGGGRVPVLLHLLGPNFRPVQITDDLKSFWSTTYFQVRKDLRVRYPKHSWPEEPLKAQPVAKGRPRGTKRPAGG